MDSLTQNFLKGALPRLEGEQNLLGVVNATSGADPAGGCSELELDLVYAEALPDAEARARIARAFGSYVAGYEDEKNASFVALYDEPVVQVTFRFTSEDEADGDLVWDPSGKLAESRARHRPRAPSHAAAIDLQWAEDRVWLWTHRAACHLRRGEIFAALDLLARIRADILAPLLALRHGRGTRALRGIEGFGGEDLAGLRASVALYDARSCEISLREAAKFYLGLREQLASVGLRRNRRAELATLRHLHEVSEELVRAG